MRNKLDIINRICPTVLLITEIAGHKILYFYETKNIPNWYLLALKEKKPGFFLSSKCVDV